MKANLIACFGEAVAVIRVGHWSVGRNGDVLPQYRNGRKVDGITAWTRVQEQLFYVPRVRSPEVRPQPQSGEIQVAAVGGSIKEQRAHVSGIADSEIQQVAPKSEQDVMLKVSMVWFLRVKSEKQGVWSGVQLESASIFDDLCLAVAGEGKWAFELHVEGPKALYLTI